MVNLGYKRLRALGRHYYLSSKNALGLSLEYGVGWVRFIGWLPRVGPKLLSYRSSNHRVRETLRENSELPSAGVLVRFINLDRRTDRRQLIEAELIKINQTNQTNSIRFAAIENDNGSLGCAQSHIGALKSVSDLEGLAYMICEDDFELVSAPSLFHNVLQEFLTHPSLDILCLSYRLRGPKINISPALAIANNIQTTACYVVKRHAVKALIVNFTESERLLSKGVSPSRASIDIRWKILQRHKLVFAIPRQTVARQRPSFSDIVGRYKDYQP